MLANANAPRGSHAAAVELLDGRAGVFRATARRYSLCAADADDAFQGAVEILLTRAPDGLVGDRLAAWMQVVTRREALRIGARRRRLLGGDAAVATGERAAPSALEPAERYLRRVESHRHLRLLARLKPQERRALVLQGQGYSYAEIQVICGWTYTKVNRCLAEGRARLRTLAEAGAVS